MPSSVFDHPPRDFRSNWFPDRVSVVLEEEDSERRGRPEKGDLLDAGAIVARQKEQHVDLSIVGGWVDAMLAPTDAERQRDWSLLGVKGSNYLKNSDRVAILGANAERIFPLHQGTIS